MKIAWVSEMSFVGKIDKDNDNLKSDVALICSADAYHFTINQPMYASMFNDFDFIMVNCTRAFFTNTHFINLIPELKRRGKKIGFFQEKAINEWHDWEMREQVEYIKTMKLIDAYFVSNQRDMPYYQHYCPQAKIFWQKSPINLEKAQQYIVPKDKRRGIMIGGTFSKWYNGMTSLEIANDYNDIKVFPRMGRFKNEEVLYYGEISNSPTYVLQYSNFDTWIKTLATFKYGIHCMPTYAAGSFHTNCAALGIPCIGSEEIDTQRILFPDLSIHTFRDIEKGKELLKRLSIDENFYNEVVTKALNKVKEWDINVVGEELKKNIKTLF